ncbi:GTPase [Aurantibacter sp.]|uniref:GTPase n=1 Tax=Aurantibacter sp. TaxID=2807103 RepID=UPI0032674F24
MKPNNIHKLIFVYNAETGFRNQLIDGAHKVLSPSTYNCQLCAITFGAFTENSTWKKFREDSNISMEFLHKDEYRKKFASKFGHNFTFPIVLGQTDNELEIVVKTEEMNAFGDVESLIKCIRNRV